MQVRTFIRTFFLAALVLLPLLGELVAFEPFTGRTTRSRVRMRTGADLSSHILQELDQGTLLAIVGEEETFYAVNPPKGIKGYIYRTYLLDNVVDGTQVNVRLEPSLEAPIVAQLNKGDHVEGKISALNSKWMEISLPPSVHFYVAKDFVEKLGGPDMIKTVQSRMEEASRLVNHAYVACQLELQKPYAEINLSKPMNDLHEAISHFTDIPEQVARAKKYVTLIEDNYEQKRRAAQDSSTTVTIHEEKPLKIAESTGSSEAMSGWLPTEAQLFEEWLKKNPHKGMEDFYADQRVEAVQLKGIIQPYTRPIKNRPGNYLLINHQDHQPIAFLYSTKVDLQQNVGQVVSLVALHRPNHNFAFPSFFVLAAE